MFTDDLLSVMRSGALTCCLAILAPALSLAQSQPGDAEVVKIAEKFAGHLTNERYEQAAALFDAAMTKALPVTKLREVWESVRTSAGPFEALGKSKVVQSQGFAVVTIPAVFRNARLNLRIAVNAERRISGFWIKPGGATATYMPPEYDKPKRYREEDVAFGKEPWRIKGKLTLPRGEEPAPAVVLVHGSGPHDEDETIGPNKPFKDLAVGLASQGIAVLRYQKRTFAHGAQLAQQETITVREEVIDDALAALAFLRGEKGIDKARIYLLGHSLGGTLAPQIAAEDEKLAGVILMAGSPRDSFTVIEEQLEYIASLPGPQQQANRKVLEESRETIARLRDGSATENAKLLGAPASYWREVSDYSTKAPKVLAGLDCRILVLGGGRDYQVTRVDFDLYGEALRDCRKAKLQWYEQMNHLFVKGKGRATPQEYEKQASVSKMVINDLAEWIKTQP